MDADGQSQTKEDSWDKQREPISGWMMQIVTNNQMYFKYFWIKVFNCTCNQLSYQYTLKMWTFFLATVKQCLINMAFSDWLTLFFFSNYKLFWQQLYFTSQGFWWMMMNIVTNIWSLPWILHGAVIWSNYCGPMVRGWGKNKKMAARYKSYSW